MMEREKLRKADFFSGGVVLAVGLFIISQGVQMPMKDSWGGVQNVWFVSPALFPLFVGAMLCLLGALLMRTAVRSVGAEGLREVFQFIGSSRLMEFLKTGESARFYGIVLNLFVYVYLMVPRIDFFLASVFFLLTFFFMYYCGGHDAMMRFLWLLLGWAALLLLLIAVAADQGVSAVLVAPLDWLAVVALVVLVAVAVHTFRDEEESRRKLRTSLLLGITGPLLIGVIFKFLLLVPLPREGIVVWLLELIWYAEIWS